MGIAEGPAGQGDGGYFIEDGRGAFGVCSGLLQESVMLTFEQVEPALHKWARHYRNNLFEHWELINEVWAMGNVQKLTHINLASRRIKWDMIDYMRKMTNSRTVGRRKAQGKFCAKTHNIDALHDENKDEAVPSFLGVQEQAEFDTDDYFEWLAKGFSRREKLIITLKYQCGYNLAEIAKVIGVTESAVSLRHKNIMFQLRAKLLRAGEQVRTCTRLPRRQTETDRVRFYQRMYYALNKERILAQNKASLKRRTA
jgi:RNA polymerase sigma factor (sigma-70 family)